MAVQNDWTQGYVTDTLYTDNIYREISPAWINYVAVQHGCQPLPLDRDFTYIELGCGLGHSVNLYAAAFPKARFFGVDFNPAHIEHAARYARNLGLSNARFIERSFQDLGEVDLPDFDVITLHGIYSWISPDARQAVQKFIYEKLKPGGLVYNSYNALPGWAPDEPLRRLLVEFSELGAGSSVQRAGNALKQMSAMKDFKLGYFQRVAEAGQQIESMKQRPQNYLVHEYLNRDWTLFYSPDVLDEMAAAKLDYVGSASLVENHLDLILPEEAARFVRQLPTPRLQQLAQDYLTGQRFRRDVFVRGHPRLNRLQVAANLARSVFAATGSTVAPDNKVKIPRGEISFDAEVFPAIREALGLGVLSLADLLGEVRRRTNKKADVERVIAMLAAAGQVLPGAQAHRASPLPNGDGLARVKLKLRLPSNQAALKEMTEFLIRRPLASIATGGGVALDPIDALILQDLIQHGINKEATVKRLGDIVKQRGLKLNRDGKEVADGDETITHLTGLTERFIKSGLGQLVHWGIAEAA